MSKLYQHQQCTGGRQQHVHEGMPERDTTCARPGSPLEWVRPTTRTSGSVGARRGPLLKSTGPPTSTTRGPSRETSRTPRTSQWGNMPTAMPPDRSGSGARKGHPEAAFKNFNHVFESVVVPCRDYSMGRLSPACGEGRDSQNQRNPRRDIGGVGFRPKHACAGGGGINTQSSRHRCLARGGNTAWHLSSLANQVLGSSPWGANRGRKAAGRTSFWEVEPKH